MSEGRRRPGVRKGHEGGSERASEGERALKRKRVVITSVPSLSVWLHFERVLQVRSLLIRHKAPTKKIQ